MGAQVEVIVLSYNRVEYLRETIKSLLSQSLQSFKLVISENSTNSEVSSMLAKEFSHIEVRRRQPSLSSENHFNQVLSEATGDYVMIFHDDDCLLPEGLNQLFVALDSDESLSAVGANAYIIRQNRFTTDIFAKNLKQNITLFSTDDLIQKTICLDPQIVPFPSYLYRRSSLQGLRFSRHEGRKYLDVSFLLKVLSRGPILWIAKPVMNYRFHGSNDSGAFSVVALNSLINHLKAKWGVNPRAVRPGLYQIKHHLFYFRQRGWRKKFWRHPHRRSVLMKAVFRFFVSHPIAAFSLFRAVVKKVALSW